MKYWGYPDFLFPLQLCHQPFEVLISVPKQQARKQFTNSSELPQKREKQSYLTIWTAIVSAPAHGCQTPVSSSVGAGATSIHRWWGHTDSSTRLSSHRVGGCGAVRLVLHHPVLTQDTKSLQAGPTPLGMAWKAPSGGVGQYLGLKDHLNHCFWDRLSALFNNTRITKQACDYL